MDAVDEYDAEFFGKIGVREVSFRELMRGLL